MTDIFMFIPNDDTQDFSSFKLQLVVKTFRHLMNQPINVFKPTNKKHYYKTF